MQQNCNSPALNQTEQEVWQQIALEFGPLDKVAPDVLRQRLATEMRVANIHGKQTIWVPPDVADAVFTDVLALCRDVSGDDRPRLKDAQRLARRFGKQLRVKKGRLNKRPRKNWFEKRVQRDACYQLKRRRRELMYAKDLSYYEAQARAAEEIAPEYGCRPQTLIWWYGNNRWRPSRRSK